MTDNVTPTLKPCPFCGAVHAQRAEGLNFQHPAGECFYGESTITLPIAAAWNTRAAEATQAAEIARLREALARIKRLADGHARIMRDTRRTGGWAGAEKTALAFNMLGRDADKALSAQPDEQGVGKQ